MCTRCGRADVNRRTGAPPKTRLSTTNLQPSNSQAVGLTWQSSVIRRALQYGRCLWRCWPRVHAPQSFQSRNLLHFRKVEVAKEAVIPYADRHLSSPESALEFFADFRMQVFELASGFGLPLSDWIILNRPRSPLHVDFCDASRRVVWLC